MCGAMEGGAQILGSVEGPRAAGDVPNYYTTCLAIVCFQGRSANIFRFDVHNKALIESVTNDQRIGGHAMEKCDK